MRDGAVMFGGQDLLKISNEELRKVRGSQIGFIFQDPMTSLNPVYTIGYQLAEPLRAHMGMNKAQARARSIELLELVGIPDAERAAQGLSAPVFRRHAAAGDDRHCACLRPAGADRRRTNHRARRDHPGPDHRTGQGTAAKLGMAIIWITHDLGVIAGIADRVMVMYAGQVVEEGPVNEIFADPQHPYTQALLKTVPAVRGPRAEKLQVIEGQPPILTAAPTSCQFRNRCQFAFDRCAQENPVLMPIHAPGHKAACFLVDKSKATAPEPETAHG
jgi:oligopeptide/dipeptide ABC transporter ATP-binding protein